MNVWIFVISALFTAPALLAPVVEPLGLPARTPAPAAVTAVDAAAPLAVAASPEAEPRFYGLERALAEIEAR